MASTKLYDLAVKVGEYTDRDGNTKGRYENIGAVFRNDNGQFLMMKRTFNPAGVPGDGDSILVSMFEPKAQGGGTRDNRQQTGNRPSSRDDLDQDAIPFAPEWRI